VKRTSSTLSNSRHQWPVAGRTQFDLVSKTERIEATCRAGFAPSAPPNRLTDLPHGCPRNACVVAPYRRIIGTATIEPASRFKINPRHRYVHRGPALPVHRASRTSCYRHSPRSSSCWPSRPRALTISGTWRTFLWRGSRKTPAAQNGAEVAGPMKTLATSLLTYRPMIRAVSKSYRPIRRPPASWVSFAFGSYHPRSRPPAS